LSLPVPPEIQERADEHVALFCANRIPENARDHVRLERRWNGDSLTISERRAPWREDIGTDWTSQDIAQLRYDASTGTWALYWATNRGWLLYDRLEPAGDVGPLLAEVGEDPHGCFWG
jgi:hypothetical protein